MLIFLPAACKEDLNLQPDRQKTSVDQNPHAAYLHSKHGSDAITNRTTYYSIPDALDYLNDGMNYLYCRPIDYYLETVAFRDTFNIAVNGSAQIDEDDLIELMDDIAEFAGNNYYADQRNDKEPLMFVMRQVTGSVYGYIPIEVLFVMEAGMPPSPGDAYPYDYSWVYGQWGSDVSNECNEENVNLDAADLFRRDLRLSLIYRKSNTHYYFKNPYTVCFSGIGNNCDAVEIPPVFFQIDESYDGSELDNPNDITSEDNEFDLLIFSNYSGYPNYHTCLSVDEMNFYYLSMSTLCNSVLPNPIGDKVIAQIEVGYDLIAGGGSSICQSLLVIMSSKVSVTEEEHQVELPCTEC